MQNPECRQKPEINEVSRILAAGKRTNEPVHERLFKQETLSKKIAAQLRANSKDSRDNNAKNQRSKSSEQNKKHNLSKSINKGMNESFGEGKSLSRVRSANRFRKDEKIEQLQNPGARLY